MQTFSAVKLAHYLLAEKFKSAKCIIDATAGNGKDTKFLAENSNDNALIWSFDIQETALTKAKQLLCDNNLEDKVQLVLDSHVNIAKYAADIDIAMFNLGYLPGQQHIITTNAESTIEAVKTVLNLLNIGGVITLVAYPGHEQGYLEYQALECLFKDLSADIFTVGRYTMINHLNKPPILYIVEKVRSEVSERLTPC